MTVPSSAVMAHWPDEPSLESSIDDFFIRSGLSSEDQLECYSFIEGLYPGRAWVPAPCQGYCSLTAFVGDDDVVQFRPSKYRLDLQIVGAVREVYGSFAPDTRYIATIPKSGLLVYCMNRIAGVSLKHIREISTMEDGVEYRAKLCVDFASFVSRSWYHGNIRSIPLGMIGSSITSRLESLRTELPARFRPVAEQTLRQMPLIEALPWVLTHGDILPGNIIVEPSSGQLHGLVDWAETERLPFGICLYGLEEILGEATVSGFQYHVHATDLRGIFWNELKKRVPELLRAPVLRAVKLARDLGVLLWYGIAFDNGNIDRVVQEGTDVEEIRKLDAFLEFPSVEDAENLEGTN